ncbi:hypothetical protein ACFL1L_05655, partial [Thermoplasmatota archaeon]
ENKNVYGKIMNDGRVNWKKIKILLILIIIIIPCYTSITEKLYSSAKSNKISLKPESQHNNISNIFTNNILSQRSGLNNLYGNDEGPHQNNFFYMKEWWYYNVFFNNQTSDLKDWFLLISIQIYPNFSGLKLELYDDNNKSFGGDKWLIIDDLNSYGPGVNNYFNNSYQIGKYPDWRIYAEYNKKNETKIIVNLTFKANSLPRWLIKNTGLNQSNSIFGYYCIMNCSVKGTISINDTINKVNGLGYHDHTWTPLNFKKLNVNRNLMNLQLEKNLDILKFWDWLCIHL